jgi:hypothetical protein
METPGNEFKPVMHEDTKQLFLDCIDSLSLLINSSEENNLQKAIYEGMFNMSNLMRVHHDVQEHTEKEVAFDLHDWILIYTAFCLHCVLFSEHSLSKMKSEVLAHPELGTEDLAHIHERAPIVRAIVNNLQKRLGHKPLFRSRFDEITRRGWFKMMDPLPHYTILK